MQVLGQFARKFGGARHLRIAAWVGSDHTPFLQHLGVASLNLEYGGEVQGGIYHSIYDDFYWYTHFGDTDFKYGRTLAQTGGTAMMRMADADLLPFEFVDFADDMKKCVGELKKLASTAREETIEKNREIEEGMFTATADPAKPEVAPSMVPMPPFLHLRRRKRGGEAHPIRAELPAGLAAIRRDRGGALRRRSCAT